MSYSVRKQTDRETNPQTHICQNIAHAKLRRRLNALSSKEKMHAGSVTCWPLATHVEYVLRALLRLEKIWVRQTDGRQTVTLRLPPDVASVTTGSRQWSDYISVADVVARWDKKRRVAAAVRDEAEDRPWSIRKRSAPCKYSATLANNFPPEKAII